MKHWLKMTMIGTLFWASLATGADWTEFLKPLQMNCGYDRSTDRMYGVSPFVLVHDSSIPAHLKGDIVSHSGSDIVLKNATAFGYPLNAIKTFGMESDLARLELHFERVAFDKLLPTFYRTLGTLVLAGGEPKAFQGFLHFDLRVAGGRLLAKEIPYLGEDPDLYVFDESMDKFVYWGNEYISSPAIVAGTPTGWFYSDASYGYYALVADEKEKVLACVYASGT